MLLGINLKDANKKIESNYNIPYNTVLGWSKKNVMNDWRLHIHDRLKTYIVLEEKALQELKSLFKEEELKILIASLNGTLPTVDLIREGFLEIHLQDTLAYETQNVVQFLDVDADAEVFINATISKLKSLDQFKRYVLVQFCVDFWEKFNTGLNLEEYIK